MAVEASLFAGIDRVVHEPSRAIILSVLARQENADFIHLKTETGLTGGNLSVHLAKLEDAGYVRIQKTHRGRIPLTRVSLTPQGRLAFENYRLQLMEFVRHTRE